MVKFEIELKQKVLMQVKKALTDFAKIIDAQTAYIRITEKELRFYNVLPNLNHDYFLGASLVFGLDDIAEKRQVSIKDKSREINLSLNKISDVLNTLSHAQYYNEMTLKLVKDTSDKRSLRLKFSKQDSQEMVYINDCGIEFTTQRYLAAQESLFEFEIKSYFLKGLMELSHKTEESLDLNFLFQENKLELQLQSQFISMAIDCSYARKAESLANVPAVSHKLFHRYCKRLTQSINFDLPLKFGITNTNELFIETKLIAHGGKDEDAIGKFRFIIPLKETKEEDL